MTKLEMKNIIEVKKDDLFPDTILTFPIYFNVAGQFVLYKPKGAVFNQKDRERLDKNYIKILYMPEEYEYTYELYFADNVSKVVADTKMPVEKKSQYLAKSAGHVVREIFDYPDSPQSFVRSQTLVKNFVDFLKQGTAAFHSIVSLSIHDFYTYTHSVGVMTYSIALASQIGVSARQTIEDIGTAGLLHDIGKSKIPLEIINKPGPLNDEEWKIMKKHSTYSYEIAADYKKLPEVCLIAIKQHHENLLGTGYPDGISGTELHFFSKLISVCDIYSALTTDRPYSKGKTRFQALQVMKSIVEKGQIDKNMFQNLVIMMSG